MKSQSKRGGARPNSGPKTNIELNLFLYNVSLNFDVSIDRARRLKYEYRNRPELLIGKERLRKVRKCAASKDANLYLAVARDLYLKRRKELGYKS
jgi:hypothetical protein